MTDTQLILNRLDSMQKEITQMHVEMNDMHTEINGMHTEMNDMYTELSGKIEAVRLSVLDVRDRMDTMEFALQTEISKTYDLAQENAKKINRLLYNRKVVTLPIS